MARRIATGDNIVCSVGACGPLGSGAYTMVWLYQIPLFSGIGGLGALRRSSTFAREAFITSSGKFFGAGDFEGFSTSPEAQWVWVAQRKVANATAPAGNKPYEWAYGVYPITDPDTQITFGQTVSTFGDPGAGDQVYIGLTDVQGNPTRDIALQAFFDYRLSNAQIKAAFTANLSDLMALSPAGCWPLNQASTSDAVTDATGNGANQTSLTGTTVVANPPGYSFSLTPPVIEGAGSAALGGITASGAGTRLRLGAGAASLGGLSAAGAGVRAKAGSGAALLGAVFGHGTGDGASGGPGHAVLTASRPSASMAATRPNATMEVS